VEQFSVAAARAETDDRTETLFKASFMQHELLSCLFWHKPPSACRIVSSGVIHGLLFRQKNIWTKHKSMEFNMVWFEDTFESKL